MKFLETVTGLGYDALVNIEKIKFISFGHYEGGWCIKIYAEEGEWIECFGKDEDSATKRYEVIKKILKAG